MRSQSSRRCRRRRRRRRRRSSSTSPVSYVTLLYQLNIGSQALSCQACNLNLNLDISFWSPSAIDIVLETQQPELRGRHAELLEKTQVLVLWLPLKAQADEGS